MATRNDHIHGIHAALFPPHGSSQGVEKGNGQCSNGTTVIRESNEQKNKARGEAESNDWPRPTTIGHRHISRFTTGLLFVLVLGRRVLPLGPQSSLTSRFEPCFLDPTREASETEVLKWPRVILGDRQGGTECWRQPPRQQRGASI